ncbi:serine/threonine kinase [Aureococcus anophagefferens]|nr:serine/threonine kinase [Aureococcus anophagefferens]
MSPEVLRGDGYDWKSDVWSLGCVLYELAMLVPFKAEGLNLYSLFQKISKADYEPLPDTYSAPLRDLATAMLSVDPAERPDVAYVCDVATRMRKETMSAAAAARAEAQRAAPSEAKGEDRGDDAKTTAVVAPAAFADAKRPQAAPEDARRDVLEAPRAPPKRDPAVGARFADFLGAARFLLKLVGGARRGGDDFCEESPQVLATALLRDLVDAGYPAERAAQCKPRTSRGASGRGIASDAPDEGGDGGEVDDDDIAEDIADAGDADVVADDAAYGAIAEPSAFAEASWGAASDEPHGRGVLAARVDADASLAKRDTHAPAALDAAARVGAAARDAADRLGRARRRSRGPSPTPLRPTRDAGSLAALSERCAGLGTALAEKQAAFDDADASARASARSVEERGASLGDSTKLRDLRQALQDLRKEAADLARFAAFFLCNAQNWRQKNALAAKDDDDDGFEVDSLLTDSVS